MTYRPHMLPKIRSAQIMAAAAGSPCTLRIASFAGLRCAGSSTTVAAHLPTAGKGIATKSTDLAAVFACATCHDILDGRHYASSAIVDRQAAGVTERMLQALVETHALLVQGGIIVVPDAELHGAFF